MKFLPDRFRIVVWCDDGRGQWWRKRFKQEHAERAAEAIYLYSRGVARVDVRNCRTGAVHKTFGRLA